MLSLSLASCDGFLELNELTSDKNKKASLESRGFLTGVLNFVY